MSKARYPVAPNVAIDKKIKKVLKKMTEDTTEKYDKNYQIILKEFGDINYRDYNNNSLAHLFITVETKNIRKVQLALNTLDKNMDLNIKNNEGQTFLQSLVTSFKSGFTLLFNDYFHYIDCVDVNSTDKQGNTLMHNCVLSGNNFSDIEDTLSKMLYLGYDCKIKNNDGQTFFDILEEKYNRLVASRDFSIMQNLPIPTACLYDNLEFMDNIRYIYYNHNMKAFFDKLTDDKEYNKKLILEVFNWTNSMLLYACLELPEEENSLKTIERLLQCGCDPKQADEHYESFISRAIKNNYCVDTICKLVELAIMYGFDINSNKSVSLMGSIIEYEYSDEDIETFYIFISKYGYKNLVSDLHASFSCFYNWQEIISNLRIRWFKTIFKNEANLIKLDTSIEQINNKKCFEVIFSVIDEFKESFDFNNDYEFVKNVIEDINYNRTTNINVFNNIVDEKEILTSVRNCINKLTNKKLNKIMNK